MDNNFDIIWQDQKVGRIENCIPDMWYLEGVWVNGNTSKSNDFEGLIATFDAKEVMRDPQKGTRVILSDRENDQVTHALIISLSEGRIFLRRVFDSEAVKWLLENVK